MGHVVFRLPGPALLRRMPIELRAVSCILAASDRDTTFAGRQGRRSAAGLAKAGADELLRIVLGRGSSIAARAFGMEPPLALSSLATRPPASLPSTSRPRRNRSCSGSGAATIAGRESAAGGPVGCKSSPVIGAEALASEPLIFSSLLLSIRARWSNSFIAKPLFSLASTSISPLFRAPFGSVSRDFALVSATFRPGFTAFSISTSARRLVRKPPSATSFPRSISRWRRDAHLRRDTPQTPASQRASSGIGPQRS